MNQSKTLTAAMALTALLSLKAILPAHREHIIDPSTLVSGTWRP